MNDDKKYDELMKIGKSAAASIVGMVAALECDYDRLEDLQGSNADNSSEEDKAELEELIAAAGECTSRDEAEQRIHEDALSVEVRSAWTTQGEPLTADEFCILLGTGGPAVRIVGDLTDDESSRPRLEVQDWGMPWTEYRQIEQSTLEAYVGCFYFGE